MTVSLAIAGKMDSPIAGSAISFKMGNRFTDVSEKEKATR
jgi:hypothetical protein